MRVIDLVRNYANTHTYINYVIEDCVGGTWTEESGLRWMWQEHLNGYDEPVRFPIIPSHLENKMVYSFDIEELKDGTFMFIYVE